MAFELDQLFILLDESGLLSAADARAFCETFPTDRRPSSGDTALDALVAAEKLTQYQADVLREGTAKGLVLGEYTLLAQIGAGGMGQVYKARHRRLKRVVALKVLPPSAVDSEEAVARFQQEMETMARLDHPNVVIAHDAGEADGIHFLVMQYVDGEDLSSLIARRGTLPVAHAVSYILQAARGLAYAHGEGVIHRDLKPANLLVDKHGIVKVLDMGLARLTDTAQDAATAEQLTGTGQIMGTVDYMSPEQAMNTKNADHRSDIYSLGCTLHALLTRRPLFDGESVVEKILAHREQAVRSLALDRSDVPPQLDAIFQKMVAKRREDRFQTMQQVVAQLEALERDGSLSQEKPSVSEATITSLSDSTNQGRAANAPKTVDHGATITMVEPAAPRRSPAQQDTLSSLPANEETHTNMRSSSSRRGRHHHRPRRGRKRAQLVPILTLLVICGALAFVLSQQKYRNAIVGLFRSGNTKETGPDVPPVDSGSGVDLLKLVELRRDTVVGTWRRDGETLVSPDNAAARLELPYVPPSEYELTLVVEPIKGNSGLVLGLVAEGHQVTAVLDLKGNLSGLATDDSFAFPDPATQFKGTLLDNQKATTVICRVRQRRLTVEANGRTVVDYRGNLQRLAVHNLWRVPNPAVLYIGSAVSSYRISRITLVPIVGTGRVVQE